MTIVPLLYIYISNWKNSELYALSFIIIFLQIYCWIICSTKNIFSSLSCKLLVQADALANRIAEEQELEELAAGNATAAMVISKTGSRTKGETTDSASEPVCMATDVAEVQILSSLRKEDLSGASNVDSEQENSENKT